MAQMLYSYTVVKKIRMQKIFKQILHALCMAALLIIVCMADSAWTQTLQVGGAPQRARVVFELDRPSTPIVTQENQALIVNFPNTVGDPTSISDVFIIEKLTFDGKTAYISMNNPFTYKTMLLEKPSRFIIDIVARDDVPEEMCPIEHIETNPHDSGITVSLHINPDHWPEIRCAENKRVYLFFEISEGPISCPDIKTNLLRAPYMEYLGTLKTQKGLGLIFSLIEENTSLEIKTDDINNKIIFEIITTEQLSRSKLYAIAKSSFDHGDVASAIHTLERYKENLDPKESILLGRAYWMTSYPYRMEKYSLEALKFMSDGIQAMTPGMDRERAMLIYSSMLLRTGMHNEAMNYIRFLKDSASMEIAFEAHLQEIDMMNKKELFQDAFVANKRMGNIFDINTIPANLEGYYFYVIGDTYLGLNAYSKALQSYTKVLDNYPSLFSYDPSIYSRIAKALYNKKDFVRAKKYTLLAINLGNPAKKPLHLLNLGDCLYQLGEKNKAMGVFSEVENIAGRSDSTFIAKLRTARILLDKDLEEKGSLSDKTYYEIMDIYESLKATDEYQEELLGSLVKIRIAQTFARRGDWENALRSYQRAWIDTNKEDPIHQYAQSEAEKAILSHLKKLYGEKQYDSIYNLYTTYQDSFMRDIKENDSLFILGDTMYQLDYNDQARPLLEAVTKISSDKRPQAISILFTMDYQNGYYSGALQWNTAYLEAYPQGADAELMRETRGELLYYLNTHEEEVVYLSPLGAEDDEKALVALSMLTDIYKRLDMKQKEVEALEKIISFNREMTSPIIEQALYTRARQLGNTYESSRAQNLFQELLNTYPQSSYRHWALYHLAIIAHSLKKEGESRKLLADVIQGSTDSVLLNAATTYLKELDLIADVHEFNKLKNRFKGK
jgi:TolA-binding protein